MYMTEKNYLTPQEVARLLMVSPVTVRQWAQRGEIEAVTTPGGHRRFTHDAVSSFARKRGILLSMNGGSRPLRVLVVDDDPQLNRFLTELFQLQSPRVEVESASNGFEAGLKVETFKPDVILLDLMMPGMDGFEVCRMVKRDPLRASIRIVALSGYMTEENAARAIEAGAETCLSKPVETQLLLDTVLSRVPLRAC